MTVVVLHCFDALPLSQHMRLLSTSAAVFACLSFRYVVEAADAAESEDVDDLNLEAEDEDDAQDLKQDDANKDPEKDFDADMSLADRKSQMGACLSYTIGYGKSMPGNLHKVAKTTEKDQKITSAQAIKAVIFGWTMNCYMSMTKELVSAMEVPWGKAAYPPDDKMQEVEQMIAVPAKVGPKQQKGSQQQWDLLATVLGESVLNQDSFPDFPLPDEPEATEPASSTAGSARPKIKPLPGISASSSSNWKYMLGVFAALFGAGIIGVQYLGRQAGKDKDRGGKKISKAEKAERLAAKKRS